MARSAGRMPADGGDCEQVLAAIRARRCRPRCSWRRDLQSEGGESFSKSWSDLMACDRGQDARRSRAEARRAGDASPAQPDGASAWHALRAHSDDAARCAPAAAVRRRCAPRRAHDGRGRRPYLDYSKNRITDETFSCCSSWQAHCGLRERIDAMFRGEKINVTEDRAVLHMALRAPPGEHHRGRRRRRGAARCTRCSTDGRPSPTACAAANGRATPASASATSSTSASAAPTSGR